MSDVHPVALITGAGSGIGRGIAIELAKNGFHIAGNDIVSDPQNRERGLWEVKDRVEELGVSFLPVQGDISSQKDHEKIVDAVANEFGTIHWLVNNAGVAPKQRFDILETTPESYDRLMHINARGPFFLTQRVANHMIEASKKDSDARFGIIFISSISAYASSPNRAEYCISKAAISHTSRIYADRLTEFGINVFEIRPGIIMTEMTAGVKEKYDKLIAEGLIPQMRWGYPEDVGKVAVALAKGYLDYSTGQAIEVSGGMDILSF